MEVHRGDTNKTVERRAGMDEVLLALKGAGVQSMVDEIVEGKLKILTESDALRNGPSQVQRFLKGATTGAVIPKADTTDLGRACIAVASSGAGSKVGAPTERASVQDTVRGIWGEPSVQRILASSEVTQGAALISETVAEEIIEPLIPRVAVLQLGPKDAPMPTGLYTQPRIGGGTTASYEGENVPALPSKPSTSRVHMSSKLLKTMVPISEHWIKRVNASGANRRIEVAITNIAVQMIGVKKDIVFLRGAGTKYSPTGLRFLGLEENVRQANPVVSVKNILFDLGMKLISPIEDQDVTITKGGFVLSNRDKNALMFAVLDAFDRPFFLEMLLSGYLLGYPYAASTQNPTNFGVLGDESEVVFADFDQVLLGQEGGLEISYSTDGTYTDATGVRHNAFEESSVLLKIEEKHDFGIEHPEAIGVLEEVAWGAAA